MLLTSLFIYLSLQVLLCWLIAQKVQTQEDYLVAGRNFPVFIISISLFATWFGAETCIGSSAAVYHQGSLKLKSR